GYSSARLLNDSRNTGKPPATGSNKPAVKGFSSMRISRRRLAHLGTPALTTSTAAMFFSLSSAREEVGKRRRAGSWWRKKFEHARARKVPVLVFLEDVPRDADGEGLARILSGYV